mmetsp:Transcript_42539/g.103235  ORF Transcript_42539/g.103235 Transcript_42539/m.103235 type:complete len:586 (+) Transcript_42539:280-2037(+)
MNRIGVVTFIRCHHQSKRDTSQRRCSLVTRPSMCRAVLRTSIALPSSRPRAVGHNSHSLTGIDPSPPRARHTKAGKRRDPPPHASRHSKGGRGGAVRQGTRGSAAHASARVRKHRGEGRPVARLLETLRGGHAQPALAHVARRAAASAAALTRRERLGRRADERLPQPAAAAAAAEARVGGELLDLVVEPAARLGRAGLVAPPSDRVCRLAHRIVPRARRAAGQRLRAAVALPRRLQPEVRVDDGGERGVRRRRVPQPRAADVAPVGAVGAHAVDAVAPRVDQPVRREAADRAARVGADDLRVVQLVVRRVVLLQQAARVAAARVRRVERAVLRDAHLHRLRRARHAERLVVGRVGGEAAEVRRDAHLREQPDVRLVPRLPPQPAAVRRVEVERDRRRLLRQMLDRECHAVVIRCLRRRVAARGAGRLGVGRQVGQRVGLDDHRDRQPRVVRAEQRGERLHVLLLVLGEPLRAVALPRVVAPAARRVAVAADLAVGRLRVAVAVGQVVENEDDERRRRLGGRVGEDPLERVGAVAVQLRLPVDPVGRGERRGAKQRRTRLAARRLDGALQLLHVGGVDVQRVRRE